jgi:hypothetical protein
VIKSDVELQATLERVELFQRQVTHLRQTEADPITYKLSAGGFLAEIDRMNREVREYLSIHPSEIIDEPALTEA